eukprot:2390790-Alexandrium_andersonii.AAC.1
MPLPASNFRSLALSPWKMGSILERPRTQELSKQLKPCAAKCSSPVAIFQSSMEPLLMMMDPWVRRTGQMNPPEVPLVLAWWSMSQISMPSL